MIIPNYLTIYSKTEKNRIVVDEATAGNVRLVWNTDDLFFK